MRKKSRPILVSFRRRRRKAGAVKFRGGVGEPQPQILGMAALDEDVISRRVIELVERDARLGKGGLRALPGREAPRVKVDAASLGEHVAGMNAAERYGGPA